MKDSTHIFAARKRTLTRNLQCQHHKVNKHDLRHIGAAKLAFGDDSSVISDGSL